MKKKNKKTENKIFKVVKNRVLGKKVEKKIFLQKKHLEKKNVLKFSPKKHFGA